MNLETFLNQPQTGIIIIDMQPEFLKHVEHKHSLLSNQAKLLQQYPHLPVIGVETIPDKNGKTKSKLKKIIKANPAGAIVPKHTQSAFRSSQFIKQIKKMNLKNILLTGIYSSCCVYATARDKGRMKIGIDKSLISDIKNIEYKPQHYIARAKESQKWYPANCQFYR